VAFVLPHATIGMQSWLNSIERLKILLHERKDLWSAIEAAIGAAGLGEVSNLPEFYALLERMLMQVPSYPAMDTELGRFHYIISSSPGGILEKDETFGQWLSELAADHGSYLDTVESGRLLESFIRHPDFHIREYIAAPSGWLTFNQFFARHAAPGKRPVAGACDSRVIVSATDSVYLGCWPIDEGAAVHVKGVSYRIPELLEGSAYGDKFQNGIFTHSYLSMTDYHRYHVPVSGIIKEVRKIPGRVIAHTVKDEKGSLTTKDEVGFQFRQTRAVVILETEAGLVALAPVGMGHVSSVNFTAEVGVCLAKGEEFGYFAYGGSDMILVFQQDRVKLTAEKGKHYKQGQAIGEGL